MMRPNPIRGPRPSEEGYILIWVIFLFALFSLSLTIALPKMAKEIQLDRERETMERGKQYQRAIQLYHRKFHAYPPNADALTNTNGIRFLRKKYIDPTTGKDDWKPILYGQNKTPTAMGFFGQPLAGSASSIAGTGPSGGAGINGGALNGGSMNGGASSPFGGSSPFGSSGSGFGSPTPTAPSGASPPDASSAAGASGAGGAATAGTNGSPGTGLTGQTFGGAGIIGFEPAGTKLAIMVYKKKMHYNEWEFVYDPLTEMRTQSGNTGNIGQPASNTTTPIGSPSPTQTPAPAPSPAPAPPQVQ